MTLTTLVVDNNPVLLRGVSAILEKQGCVVETATNGLEALNILKKTSPDIIFTDLVMPLVGGEQLCKIIRNTPSLADIYVVVVSGIAQEDLKNILPVENYDASIAKGTLSEITGHILKILAKVEEYRSGGERPGDNEATMIPPGYERLSVTTELLSEKKHLSTILANLEEGIVELDDLGRVVSANIAAVRMLRVREEVFIGSLLSDYPWPQYKKEISQWFEYCRTRPDTPAFEIRDEAPLKIDNTVMTATFFTLKSEMSDYRLCIFRDISRQYHAEEHERELSQALSLLKKMESMSSMAGGLAHDFNNLLTVVCGNLDIAVLKSDLGADDKTYNLLKNARAAAYKVVDLTKKISSFSPFGIISREKVKFDSFVQKAVENYFQNIDTPYNLTVESRDVDVEVDREQMERAVCNVLQNSTEAAPQGEIVIKVCLKTFDEPYIESGQYVPAGQYGCVDIADKGKGIEQENLLEVFDPYYSTKERGAVKGMGLGLAVVYATMRNHMGYVTIQSEKGVGARVRLFLPLCSSPTERQEIEEAPPEAGNVLLIEEDWQLQEIFKVMLEFLGWEVTVSNSFDEGRAEFENRMAANKDEIGVVFIDPSQSGSYSPREVVDIFHGLDRSCSLIATGISTHSKALGDYLKSGFTHILHKPYAFEEVKSVMANIEE